MKPEKFPEAEWLKEVRNDTEYNRYRTEFLQKYFNIDRFEFPKYFYFKVLNDRCHIHWAIIKEENNKAIIYFINYRGIIFDKLEYKKVKKAQRELRKNKFAFCTNQKCPYLPISPVYLKLGQGKKSAPYSKGNLWNFKERCINHILDYMDEGLSMVESYRKLIIEHPELFTVNYRRRFLNHKIRNRRSIPVIINESKKNENSHKINFFEILWKIISIILIYIFLHIVHF